jgi:hypothetical protein
MRGSRNVRSNYRAAAQLQEQQGFIYTAAFMYRKAAEEASTQEEGASCWREWERLTGLDRRAANSLSCLGTRGGSDKSQRTFSKFRRPRLIFAIAILEICTLLVVPCSRMAIRGRLFNSKSLPVTPSGEASPAKAVAPVRNGSHQSPKRVKQSRSAHSGASHKLSYGARASSS